ncbi:MAG TPA: hypothetical protein VEF90_18345, partial [Xanthobacteraceae bacterium]|nr:hypothetical protein [Xanthobacteraceae bacterium]
GRRDVLRRRLRMAGCQQDQGHGERRGRCYPHDDTPPVISFVAELYQIRRQLGQPLDVIGIFAHKLRIALFSEIGSATTAAAAPHTGRL